MRRRLAGERLSAVTAARCRRSQYHCNSVSIDNLISITNIIYFTKFNGSLRLTKRTWPEHVIAVHSSFHKELLSRYTPLSARSSYRDPADSSFHRRSKARSLSYISSRQLERSSMTPTRNESGTMSRLTGPGYMGESSGTASTKSVAENVDDNGLRRRPEFEEACLGAVEDFRRGQIDKITATTRIAFAISNDCILGFDDEEGAYCTYFSMLDRFENELRTAGSEAQADRANTRHVETETHFGGEGPQEGSKECTSQERDQVPVGTDKHHDARRKGKQRADIISGTRDPGGQSTRECRDDSSSPDESPDESTCSSSSSDEPTVSTHRKKRVKLDLRYLKRASHRAETEGSSKSLRRTNRLLDNWSKDFKEIVRRYDFCPSRPEFPLAELKNILGGQYVNLDAVLSYHYSSQSTDKQTEKVGELEFTFTTANFAQSIETSADWITAWGRVERAYRFVFPFRVDEFR